MKEISRREFIIDASAALTLAASPPPISFEFNNNAFDETHAIQHVDESGANLLFYFVNVSRHFGHLIPRDDENPSYLIAQLPAQSLHEEYFYSSANLPPTKQLSARLSGPSFLTFRLWPNWKRPAKLPREWRIAYDVSAFLEWHDSDRFALQVANDVPHGDWKALRDFEAVKDVSISSADVGSGPYDFTYYRKLIQGVLKRETTAQISVLELPAGMLLTFIDPTTDAAARISGVMSNVLFRVTQNRASSRSRNTIQARRFKWQPKKEVRIIRTVTERWNAEISVIPRGGGAAGSFTISELPPAVRAIGLVRTESLPKSSGARHSDCYPGCDSSLGADTGYLPSLADQTELAFLNQLATAQYASSRFDIHTEGPFRLTDLGGSLHMHYKNYDTSGLPGNVSLVEYEHIFEASRDNYIKVARIGICQKTSQRMLHLAIASREIRGGVSYLNYKEYCHYLDLERVFPDRIGDIGSEYDSPIKPPAGGSPIGTKWLRYPFSRVEAVVDQLKPIEPVLRSSGCHDPDALKSDPTFLDPRAFWVYQEGVGKDRCEAALLPYPLKFYDRNLKSLGVLSTAVLFLRRDFFDSCNRGLVDQWLGTDPTVQSLRMWDDGRHRVALRGQIVAFTADEGRTMPDGSGGNGGPSGDVANRPNQMATDWVECYFDVARNTSTTPSAFDDAAFPIFPQVRQARVYIDHVQHYARAKRASLIEYATEYLDSRLESTNQLKFVVDHTKEFMSNNATTLGGHPIAILDPDLPGAWDAIKKTFRDAGESLGALVNPDPALERISLTKSALSLTKSALPHLTTANASQLAQPITLDPRELFKSMDAELFAGIRLSDILGALGLDEAPQYLLTKLPPLPAAPEILATVATNPVVQRAYETAKNFSQTVEQLRIQYEAARASLRETQAEIQRIRDVIDQSLPTCTKIESAARDCFEAAALSAFQDVRGCATPECIDRFRMLATLEVLRFLDETGANRLNADVISFLNGTAAIAAKKLLAEYESINPNSPRYLELVAQYDDFAVKLRDVTDWYGNIKPTLECSPFDATAIDALANIVVLDSNGSAKRLAELTERVFRLYELVKPTVQNQDVQIWRDALAKLDAARRLNVSYLKERRDRMLRDAEDACRTLPPAVFNAVGMLEAVNNCGVQFAADLQQRWVRDRIAAMELASDQRHRQLCLQQAVSNALEKLKMLPPDIQQRLAEAQQTFETQLAALQTAADRWKRADIEDALTLSERFRTEFEAELTRIANAEQVSQAIATYARVKQLLDVVRVQDLTTDWETTRVQPADLGFLRFEPRAVGETKLTMHAGVHMEMDPLSQPPLPLRTEASAQNELTAFRITFLQVIGVDFNRASFTAGTGKATHADVQITSVNFAGSLSFIQALQSLLAGLADGLRIEQGPNNITVGYQSPSLDLSSPGFTFANFFVGLSLLIFFDRTPMRLRFSLADVERKATVSAGIYGGSFFCALTMDTSRGVIGTDTALELGAYFGVRFGPFSGFVKFMVGLRYTRDDEGVSLIGYFIAEGSLSVWVITVSARLYMGIKSQNSVVEGFCIASYSVKVGFLKKTFEAGYSKRIAGATQNSPNSGTKRAALHASPSVVFALYSGSQALFQPPRQMGANSTSNKEPIVQLRSLFDEYPELFVDEFEPIRRDDFTRFVKAHFAVLDS